MTATKTYYFGGYTLEPTTEQHLELAEKWTALDKYHAGVISPEFWLYQGASTDSYLLNDGAGPVFFLKVHQHEGKRVALHIQFMPCATEQDMERTVEGLLQGTPWLEGILRESQVEEIFFDTQSKPLIAFAIKRLGFLMDMASGRNGEFRLGKRL
jgi:hypothetical protein